MPEPLKFHVHLSSLISQARLQKGYGTLRELYRDKKPPIDYQSWAHAESGRRIPTADIVNRIGEILDIDREALLIAYCKDKFDDPASHDILESFQVKKYLNVDTLLEAKEHERTEDYVFNTVQIQAMQNDIRLRLYLNYTYDENLVTTASRLAHFFSAPISEVKSIVDQLQSLGLVTIDGENIKRVHRHTTLPNKPELFDVRKESLLKSLELNIKPNSYTANTHIKITEKSYKKILALFEFVEATVIKMEKDDQNELHTFRFQIAMAGNRLNEGSDGTKSGPNLD
jgi:hypothetical protein